MQNPVFWIATGIVVSSAMGSLACVVLFLAKLRIPTGGPATGIALILPATGLLDNLENLLAALGRQSVRARRLMVAVESRPIGGRPSWPRFTPSCRSMSSWLACRTVAVRNAPIFSLP